MENAGPMRLHDNSASINAMLSLGEKADSEIYQGRRPAEGEKQRQRSVVCYGVDKL